MRPQSLLRLAALFVLASLAVLLLLAVPSSQLSALQWAIVFLASKALAVIFGIATLLLTTWWHRDPLISRFIHFIQDN